MFTCAVNGEDEEEHAGDQVPQESDHAAGDAFGDGVHRFDEELEEDRHAAVDENAHQDAGGVEDGCKKTTTTAVSCSFTGEKKSKPMDNYGLVHTPVVTTFPPTSLI